MLSDCYITINWNSLVLRIIDTIQLGIISTRDNPGAMYEGMFLPGEDMDYDLFDEEEERLKKLRDERDKLV